MVKRLLTGLAAFFAVAGLALGTAGGASASVQPNAQFNSIGTTGYDAIGGPFHSIGAVVSTDSSAENIGGVGTGGIGVQLCDPNDGYGLQLGLVESGTSLHPAFSVDYQAGTLAGAASDSCVGNGVLPAPHVLNANLTAIPDGDSVYLYIRYWNQGTRTWHHGYWAGKKHHRYWVRGYYTYGTTGKALFQAFDASTGFEVYSATLNVKAGQYFDNAGGGVEQNTTLVSANTPTVPFVTPTFTSGAENDVADFTGVGVNGPDWYTPGTGLAHYFSNEVVSSPGSLAANPTLADAHNSITPTSGSSASAFSVYAGNPA